MQITQVTIRDVLGITELAFDAGRFNAATGPNGKGKTSVLEAVKSALGGGHDATLLRKGAKEGEVVLVLDDGSKIRRRITADGSKTDLIGVDGKKQARAVETLRSLTDLISINPVEFLRAKKDRARVLLETMPLRVDAEKLTAISGIRVEPSDEHALGVIEAVRKQVYDDRTGTNRAVREKEATINQLRAALPDAPGGVDGDEAELQDRITAANQARDAEHQRIATKLSGIESEHTANVAALRADAQAKIDAINAQLAADIAAANKKITDIRAAASRQRELATTKHAEATAPLQAAVQAVRTNRDAAAKRKATLETIATMDKELADLREDAEKQSAALDAIDAYKLDMLAGLPIPGLAVVDGEIQRDGVAFDRLNTAQQVQIAVEVAKLRAGTLGVICVDGLELLDSTTFEAFREQALASGLQMFVSRVSDGEGLGIEVDD